MLESLGAADDYVQHNELGLALDVLVDVADQSGATPACWHLLQDAANEMDLQENDATHGVARLVVRHTGHGA